MLNLLDATPHIMGLQGLMVTSVPMLGTGWPNHLTFIGFTMLIWCHWLRTKAHSRWLNIPMIAMCLATGWWIIPAVYIMTLTVAVTAICYLADMFRSKVPSIDRLLGNLN